MTVETVILFIVTLFILAGVFIGEGGIETTFQKSAPVLGARVEKELETGGGFAQASQNATAPVSWSARSGNKVIGLDTRNGE